MMPSWWNFHLIQSGGSTGHPPNSTEVCFWILDQMFDKLTVPHYQIKNWVKHLIKCIIIVFTLYLLYSLNKKSIIDKSELEWCWQIPGCSQAVVLSKPRGLCYTMLNIYIIYNVKINKNNVLTLRIFFLKSYLFQCNM